jgi:hypothetical protein
LRTLRRDGAATPWNCGAAMFFSEWDTPTGYKFSVAVRCRLGNSLNDEMALIDTGAAYTLLGEEVAQIIEQDLEPLGLLPVPVRTSRGARMGRLFRLNVTLLADPDEGEDLTIDGTVMVLPEWDEAPIIGMRLMLERVRCAFDPGAHPSEAVYFFGDAGG